MPIADDLREIARRAHRDLDEVLDFYGHSKFVWIAFKDVVGGGYRVDINDLATGTRIDQDGLVLLSPLYMRRYLMTFTFRQFVSIFEAFLFDFLHRVFLHNPWQFAERQLDFGTVLKAGGRDEVISAVLLRQLNELKYEPPREWFVALNRAVKLECPTVDEIDALAEIKATRDLLEHNSGVVNEVYRRKAGRKARYAVGDVVELDETYHLESWRLIKKVAQDVTDSAIARLDG